jgi:ABC-type transporter Mla MlaB component
MVGAKNSKTEAGNQPSDSNQNSRPYVSALKYYIHDGTEAFRFQLIGELQEADVKELSGCWQTAKSTFGDRKLVLDLQQLRSTDESGKEWLLSMVREGAACMPESYFRTNLTDVVAASTSAGAQKPSGLLGKLTSGLRGDREIPAGSPTQAP